MKRHTHDYEMFYSREAVRSFDELVRLGDSTRSKELARDYTVVERKLHRADEVTIGTLCARVSEIAMG